MIAVDDVSKILKEELEITKRDIANSIISNDRNATGKTIKSLNVEIIEDNNKITGILSGRGNISTLETGRGKSKKKGSGGWKSDLLDWMRARAIPEKAFYPIWKTLNEKGWNTSLPNRTNPNGGTKGILSDPINTGLERITKNISDASLNSIVGAIDEILKNGTNG